MIAHFHRLSPAVLLFLFSVHGWAQEDEPRPVEVLTGEHLPYHTEAPSYPYRPLQRGEEGMVEVHFMIDTEGRPFEIMVGDSMGDVSFHQESIKALTKFRFHPVEFKGSPVVTSSTYVFTYKLGDNPGASRVFANLYRDLTQAIETGEQVLIEEALAKLDERGSRNHYEKVMLNLAYFDYARRYGTTRQQMDYLHGALSKSIFHLPRSFHYDAISSFCRFSTITLQKR